MIVVHFPPVNNGREADGQSAMAASNNYYYYGPHVALRQSQISCVQHKVMARCCWGIICALCSASQPTAEQLQTLKGWRH